LRGDGRGIKDGKIGKVGKREGREEREGGKGLRNGTGPDQVSEEIDAPACDHE